jgi:hypothetical protein
VSGQEPAAALTVVRSILADMRYNTRKPDLPAGYTHSWKPEQWAAEIEKYLPALPATAPPAERGDDVTATVSELRSGEENDGVLESTDLYVRGRGLSLLVNVDVSGGATYSLTVDRQQRQRGYIMKAAPPTEKAPDIVKALELVAEARAILASAATADRKDACGAMCPLTNARCELPAGHENHRGPYEQGIVQWPRK